MRLNKAIASSGVSSRRGADALIQSGKVQVNGRVIRELGTQVDLEQDTITVEGTTLAKPNRVTYAVHKPRGVICSRVRQAKEPIVTELVPPYPPVYPVGRLDKESEGLIFLSNDGTLTHTLTHPSFAHEREYLVQCTSTASEPLTLIQIQDRLEKGVKLSDGKAVAENVSIRELAHDILEIRLTVREGRHHLIRRMCATLKLKVRRLIRTRIGPITLSNLSSGHYRPLSSKELRTLLA